MPTGPVLARPLTLKEKPTRKKPTKLAAILCGFNENYAAILALMSIINGEAPFINFDKAHDEYVLNNQDYFCSNGTIQDVQTLYEEFWYTLPYIKDHKEMAEEFWKDVLRPALDAAKRQRIEKDDSVVLSNKAVIYGHAIANFDHLKWVSYSELYMCRDEIATSILDAADFIKQMILAELNEDFYTSARVAHVQERLQETAPNKSILINFPYFRINTYQCILTSEDPNLRWCIFAPIDETKNIKVCYLRTKYAQSHNKPAIAQHCEADRHCTWFDNDFLAFSVDKYENVFPLLIELNDIIDRQFSMS